MTSMTKTERIASHVVIFLIWTLVLVNVGFIFGITISEHTLPVSYFTYLLGVLIWKIRRGQGTTLRGVLCAILIPAFFILAGTQLFAKMFDASYDGQAYHQVAVINLSKGWNPMWGTDLPVSQHDPFVIGYPKSLWVLQSSFYKMFPEYINVATVTNLVIVLLASVFVFGLLRRLRFSNLLSAIITSCAILHPAIIQQFFTFMADGFSYGLLLLAISSLGILMKNVQKSVPLAIFFSSLLLLIGTKFSNLLVVGVLGAIGGIYILKLILNSIEYNKIIAVSFFVGAILMLNPFITNILRYSSPVYPSNLRWAQEDLQYQNKPKNLRDANKLELLFYGIFSKAQVASAPDSEQNIAQLKIPFTISKEEIGIVNNYQGRVGSEGVLFGGLIIFSFVILTYLLLRKKDAHSWKEEKLVMVIIVLIFLTALANPVANKLRYAPQLYLVPIVTLCGLSLTRQTKQSKGAMIVAGCFVFLILLNSSLKLVPNALARFDERSLTIQEMEKMKVSGIRYDVQSNAFYSNYLRLQEYGVNIRVVEQLTCPKPHPLHLSGYVTFYCP